MQLIRHACDVSNYRFGTVMTNISLSSPQALIGDKYGPRPYPSLIEAEEFQILYDAGKAEGADVLLLDDWYIRDDNPQVAQFVLQPVTARFPFFNDEAEGNRNRKKKVRRRFLKTWTRNYIHCFLYDVITHPCPNFNGGLTKPPLKLQYGFNYIQLF